MNRLDKELHRRGLAKSRTASASLIAEGKVAVNRRLCTDVSRAVQPDDLIEITGEPPRYVSRGGLKLECALEVFGINLSGVTCLDAGASTGGFTDCMLQHGASRVYAVDVGSSQLDATLRDEPRVVSMERCDIRALQEQAQLPEKVGFASVDLSFISVKQALPAVKEALISGGGAVVLIKPQFELGRKHKGVITDTKLQAKIVEDITGFAEMSGFTVKGVIESPILGKEGNREFLMWVNN